jgi:hypothetical protein
MERVTRHIQAFSVDLAGDQYNRPDILASVIFTPVKVTKDILIAFFLISNAYNA